MTRFNPSSLFGPVFGLVSLTATLFYLPTAAQETAAPASAPASANSEKPMHRFGIGLHGGLVGGGFDLGYQINPLLGLRAKYSLLPFEIKDQTVTFSGQNLLVNANINLNHADLILDFYPFKNAIRLSAGLGFFAGNEIMLNAAFTDSTKLGEITFSPEDIGSLGMQWKLNDLNPYIGLGFGRAAPKGRIGLGLDMGAYYIGPPKPEILATGMVKRTSEETATLQENLKDYKWMPVFSLRLAVALF